jgi:hypothetical protein
MRCWPSGWRHTVTRGLLALEGAGVAANEQSAQVQAYLRLADLEMKRSHAVLALLRARIEDVPALLRQLEREFAS